MFAEIILAAHVPEPARDVRTHVVDLLQFLQRRFGVLARLAQRIAGDHAKAPLAHREQAHEAMLGRENVEIGVG